MLGVHVGALVALLFLDNYVRATAPSINVGLRTSFDAPPYLVELLFVVPWQAGRMC